MNRKPKPTRKPDRRGAATVEMAVVAPVFLAVLLGLTETSRLYETQNHIKQAVRSGARLAAMDREGITGDGLSTNQKVADDIRAFLDATGIDGDAATVDITAVDSTEVFDLDDPENDLDLFTVTVKISMEDLALLYGVADSDAFMSASITLRNARSTLVQ